MLCDGCVCVGRNVLFGMDDEWNGVDPTTFMLIEEEYTIMKEER
jgi:hypothetical protein